MATRDDIWVTRLLPFVSSVPVARHFASAACLSMGCGTWSDQIQLLVSELVSNVVRHARTPMRLSLFRRGDHFRVEVRDDDPRPMNATAACPATDSLGGRGMFLVSALASTWGVNSNTRGKTVWFELP